MSLNILDSFQKTYLIPTKSLTFSFTPYINFSNNVISPIINRFINSYAVTRMTRKRIANCSTCSANYSGHGFNQCTSKPDALFLEHISTLSGNITSFIKSKVAEWMLSQASFIQALLGNIC